MLAGGGSGDALTRGDRANLLRYMAMMRAAEVIGNTDCGLRSGRG